jgi:threonylcarbamoyladenosine tRNA methylthiotransferase MtaB
MDWSDDLLSLIAREPRMANHVHMPLQSGSDAVLKRMYRKYRTRHYAQRLETAHRLMPDVAIGADVMTGFPGETEDEFNETIRFVENHPFTYLHVFTYSERPGTVAPDRGFAVPVNIRRERTRILRQLSDAKNLRFRQSMIGKTVRAVTLEQRDRALTTNFVNVEMRGHRAPNQLIDVAIAGTTNTGVREAELFPICRSQPYV